VARRDLLEGDDGPCVSADASAHSKQAAVGMAVTTHAGGHELLVSMRGGGMEIHQLGAAMAEPQSNEAESVQYWLETV